MKAYLKKIVVLILQQEAKLILRKYKPQIVGITGSVGKTSTKDAVYSALCNFYTVRKSQKSFNSEFGVPLTVIGIRNVDSVNVSLKSLFFWLKVILEGFDLIILPNLYPEWLVLEIGADRPGDIEAITKWTRPDISIVTKLSKTPVHVEFFPTVEDLYKEKSFLVRNVRPGGTVILNIDDEDVLEFRNLSDEKSVLFGNQAEADVRAHNYQVLYENNLPSGISFEVQIGKVSHVINLRGTLGAHHAYHILSALAVVHVLREETEVAAKNFSKHEPTPGRMRLVKGIKDSMIIDDTYNSSPVALSEALNTLRGLKAKRKIAVLGDMLELGKYSKDAHIVGGIEASQSASILVTVGVRARTFAESALNEGMDEKNILQFDSSKEAGDYLQNIIKKGDVILVKGSQGVRMEKAVEEIMAESDKKSELLVRQDGFWKSK